ncbi:MAG: ABC transporter ATP-binding protein [Stellaceae bacterium]
MSLRVSDLRGGYGKKRVLNGVSLEVGEHEIVALVGHNGAGKSTLLKSIFGLLPDIDGAILWFGDPILGRSPTQNLRAGIVYCPEGAQVFRTLTVRENLELGGYALSDPAALKRNLSKVLDLFPALANKAAVKGGQLSGGERQMLAIGIGLIAEPKLAMFDEPSGGLAPMLVEAVFEAIRVVVRDFDTSVLLVEQNIDMAFRVADRAYVLANGAIVDSGLPADLIVGGRLHRSFFGGAESAPETHTNI